MAEYIDYTQATTLFGDVDARFDTVEGKIPSNASSDNKMVTASDIATKADLVNGLVPANQLPSFVDDVLMGTAQNITETAAGTYSADGFIISGESTPTTLEDGKTYVDTATNIQFRYTGTGSNLVSMGSNLALGETATTAYAGNKGKANADAISDIQDLIPSGASTSNKLATASDIPDTSGLQPKTLATTIGSYTTVEGALSGINDGKVDKVTGKGLSTNDYDATAKGIVDSIPLTVSQLQGSLLEKFPRAEQRVLGAKNLLEYPYINTTKTENGITFTDNGDGTVTVNGTATAATKFYLMNTIKFKEIFNRVGAVILNGCPSGGGDYRIITQTSDGYKVDSGNGILLDKVVTDAISIEIKSGVTVSNLVFKPMLRLASDTDDTYVPYAMTNRELTDELTVQESEIDTTYTVGDLGNHLVKYGKIVNCVLRLNGVTATSWDVIGNVPSGFRPKYKSRFHDKGTDANKIHVGTDGKVYTTSNLNNSVIILSDTWITS